MTACLDCPRKCGIDRATSRGFCRMGESPALARAALHFWEEPCVSGTRGSGTVFFSGCNLRCVYCQNHNISRGKLGKEVPVSRLREIYHELIQKGAHNINLVTPTHFLAAVLESLKEPLPVPVVYNTSGYESPDAVAQLSGRVQVYLVDLKYLDGELSQKYSGAEDYPAVAKAAIDAIYEQVGPYRPDESGLIQSGVIIRHLILPGNMDNTFDVIDYVGERFKKGEILFSLMSQYVPCGDLRNFPELRRTISQEEYDRALSYLRYSPIVDGYVQDMQSASDRYIPNFDMEGI